MPDLPLPHVSVLTIAAGRPGHLANLVRGLQAQTEPPRELIVAVMQEAPYEDLPSADFPVCQIPVEKVGEELPLAAARNRAAEAAGGEVLAFLDLDCIPHPAFVADYARAARPGRGLVMGEVLYLAEGATGGGLDFARFDRAGVRHSDRQAPPEEGLRRCEDYRCFWSLNFAMHRQDWARSGGFHEGYVGYGGEDTDFGRVLADRGIGIWWIRGARVYHQYHPHCMPPIHQIPAILRNTEVFAARWGHRTMEHWLYAFQMMGLIEEGQGGLRMVREPGPEEFALCRQAPDMPYANTRRVLDTLQGIPEHERSERTREAEVARAQARLIRAAE
jgi:GT2 family glycosyltransferase